MYIQSDGSNPNSGPTTFGASLHGSGDGADAQAAHGSGSLAFAAAYLTPIEFYGKVVDQNNDTVADAVVEYSGNNIPWGESASHKTKTNAIGEFVIRTSGISLSVNVSKESYRSLKRRSDVPPAETVGAPFSSELFYYAKQFAPLVHRPDKNKPVVFTLHKSGALEYLIVQPRTDLSMEKDGSPLRIELKPGNPNTAIELQCWTDSTNSNADRQYDWRFKVTVLNGGLEEVPNENSFIAPPSGYKNRVFDYSMKKSLPFRQWKDEVAKSFFIRFEDDTYAVLDVKMLTGGDHFAVVESRLNPQRGSRNLETPPPQKPKYR